MRPKSWPNPQKRPQLFKQPTADITKKAWKSAAALAMKLGWPIA
jgi:hypothetical protein